MAFALTEEEKELQRGVRAFCEGRLPLERLRALEGSGFEAGLWRELAELGVFDPALGPVGAALVCEELARALAPGPIVWTMLASLALPGAARGECVVGGIDLLGEASRRPILIEHLEALDALLVVREDGLWRVAADELRGRAVATPLDPLTPVHEVEALPRGERIGDAAAAAELRRRGAVLVAAELVGLAAGAHERAVAYAKEREQFGRPIGSFQAIQHMLADSFVWLELARASVYAAAAALADGGSPAADRAVAAARVNASRAAMNDARTCIQVHGGMGYTWEVPAHLYFKRAWVKAACFGAPEEHARRLGETVSRTAV